MAVSVLVPETPRIMYVNRARVRYDKAYDFQRYCVKCMTLVRYDRVYDFQRYCAKCMVDRTRVRYDNACEYGSLINDTNLKQGGSTVDN